MGCSESKIDNVRTVNQCQERIAFMKQSISAQAAFVSAYFAYAAALKNTLAALRDYTQSELLPLDERLPPPHPRMHRDEILAWDFFVALMEGVNGTSFEALKIHDDNKFHYQSHYGNNQVIDQSKHSTRVMKVTNNAKVEFSSKEKETYTALLNKMLAWEKKLYDQVKAGEKMKQEYQKKIALLNKLKQRGSSSDKLKRTQTTINDLHTRYIVEMQSIDSTVSEINRLRDQHLYPKLLQIVKEMEEMWNTMRKQHEQQLTIIQQLSNIKLSQLPNNTTKQNLKNLEQIHLHLTTSCAQFEKLTLHQKEYIKSLNNWLKLNLTTTNHNTKHQTLKIKSLLHTWNNQMKQLPVSRTKTGINSFRALLATIVEDMLTEKKMKDRCDEIRTEITKRGRKFEEWCDKRMSKRLLLNDDVMDDMNIIADQEVDVEVLKRLLKDEEEAYQRRRVEVKDSTAMKMKDGLMEFVIVIMEFDSACFSMYGTLKCG